MGTLEFRDALDPFDPFAVADLAVQTQHFPVRKT
jgi:hypothetical protein